MIRKVLQNHLTADTAVTALLSTYEFTDDVSAAAIFTVKVPEDATFPCVFIAKPSAENFGTRGNKGASLAVNVSIYDDKETSDADLTTLAWAVWNSLDRADLVSRFAALDYDCHGCVADPPALNSGPDQFPAYIVKVRVWITQEDA